MTEKSRGEIPQSPSPEVEKEKEYEVKLTESDIELLIDAIQVAAVEQMNKYQNEADVSYYGETPLEKKMRNEEKARQLARWEQLNNPGGKIHSIKTR